MTDDERALLNGLEERIDIIKKALIKSITTTNSLVKQVNVLTEKVDSIIMVVNSHSEKFGGIEEAMTSHTKPLEEDDDDDYLN